ncbi:hypothetical protein C8J57DRAFT_1236991 [Mycena rebaudengoi]|nr:hypothetical protein C8J57DRAFT_1236991 [Mycena rebaudengoi]
MAVIYVEVREVCEGNTSGVGGTTGGVGGTRISNDGKMIHAIKSARETGKRAGHPAAAPEVQWMPLINQLIEIQWTVPTKSNDKSQANWKARKGAILCQNRWKKIQMRFERVTTSNNSINTITTLPQEDTET